MKDHELGLKEDFSDTILEQCKVHGGRDITAMNYISYLISQIILNIL
jgi:hypothetical protein